MIFKNTTSQKIISFFLIIAVLSPAFIIFSMPKKTNAIFGVADVVFDPALFAKEVWKVIKETIRQFLMAIARKLLDKITQSTINWINSGFRGKPLFIENPESFFTDIAKQEFKSFIGDVGYDKVRFPFGKNYALSIIDQTKATFEQNAQLSLSNLSKDELDFRRDNFGAGGWDDFILNTQFPQNNFIGFDLMAGEELGNKLSGEKSPIQEVKTAVQEGMGFLSPQVCKSNPEWDPDKLAEGIPQNELPPYNPTPGMQISIYNQIYQKQVEAAKLAFNTRYGCKEGPARTTPGSQVANSIMTALGSKQRQGELGAALGNSLAALFDALLNHFFNKGLTALSNTINPTPNPSINDFTYFGDTGGGYIGNPPANPEPKLTINMSLNSTTATLADINLYVDGNPAPINTALTYDAGGHTVSATAPVGHIISISGDCSSGGYIYLSLGDIKNCTVTINENTNPTGRLKVVKIVINDNGGSLQPEDVQIYVNGNLRLHNVEYLYDVGTYTVTENNPSGYTATFGGDCDASGSVTISQGDVLECTITNDDV